MLEKKEAKNFRNDINEGKKTCTTSEIARVECLHRAIKHANICFSFFSTGFSLINSKTY